MSVHEELKRIADDYAVRKISRRTLAKRAAALGLSAPWIAALAKGADAAPAPLWSARGANAQTDKATTFLIAVEGDVDTWDPGFTVGSKTSQSVLQNTFDQLTQYQVIDATAPDGMAYRTVDTEQIIPMLCESWAWNGNDMVFTLRDGATYSDGTPIDASTMVTGYTRILEGTISAFLISMGGAIADASAFKAPDPKTFVMTLTKANSLTPKNNVMHNNSCLNPVELEENKSESDPFALDYFKQNLGIGNGPYKLDSYKPGDSITLVHNETHYADAPPFTTVILKIIPDPIQRVQLLQNGDVDFATLIPRKEYETLKADPNLKVLSIPSNVITFLEMNGKIAPFDKKEVRQAVAYATPYQTIIDEVYKGQAQVAKSLVPSGMPTSDFSTNQYDTNLDKARELLATAGYPDGEGLPDIKLTIRIGDEQWERIAILTQASLKEVGINVEIEKLAYAAYNEAEQGHNLQFWVDEWISWVNDPYYHMFWLAVSTSPTNYPNLTNPRIDELIAEFTLAEASPERDAASKEAQALVIEECNYVFTCQPNWMLFTRNDIDGYVYYNDELPRYYHFRRTTA